MYYVIEKDGRLDQFRDNSFAYVFSVDVLEHVPWSGLPQVVRDMCRILKPGGYSIHQIGIDDHHAHYDRAVSPKQYLSFSDRTWGLFFDNNVQYINRLQRSDWLGLFEQAGLNFVEEVVQTHDIEGLRIHPQYRRYDRADLACTRLTIVHRKGPGPGDAALPS
jgi:SAM-dependent methyltransferase